jgi:thymidylate synthase (FAD)
MREVTLNVQLLAHTSDPEAVLQAALRQCQMEGSVSLLFRQFQDMTSKEDIEDRRTAIARIIVNGHHSVLEHVSFTFAISGISRACSHQLVRHRIASYSQQSQRHVSALYKGVIVPKMIKENPEAFKEFSEFMDKAEVAYSNILRILMKNGVWRESQAREDARAVLPNAYETKIVVTMNLRSLMNFFKLRKSEHAQEEIRQLASKMEELVKKALPTVLPEN